MPHRPNLLILIMSFPNVACAYSSYQYWIPRVSEKSRTETLADKKKKKNQSITFWFDHKIFPRINNWDDLILSNSNSTFIALNLYLMIDSKMQKAKIRDRNR